MKGQSAVEYMMILGMVLLMLIPLAAYTWNQSDQATKSRQAEIAVGTIAAAADSLWAQGPGAKTTINVLFPNGYDSTKSLLANRTIVLRFSSSAGDQDAVAITKANITGSLPSSSGYRQLILEAVGSAVNVTVVGG